MDLPNRSSIRPRGMGITSILCGVVVAVSWAVSVGFYGGRHFALSYAPIYILGMVLYCWLLRSYYNGKRWARILLLIQAVPSSLLILEITDRETPALWRTSLIAYGVSSLFMLLWLNTSTVTRYFKEPHAQG
jgi:hypothetical protein